MTVSKNNKKGLATFFSGSIVAALFILAIGSEPKPDTPEPPAFKEGWSDEFIITGHCAGYIKHSDAAEYDRLQAILSVKRKRVVDLFTGNIDGLTSSLEWSTDQANKVFNTMTRDEINTYCRQLK